MPDEKPTIVTPIGGNKMYAVDPNTGKSKVYDFDKPDGDMLRQMAEVLVRRLDSHSGDKQVFKLIYLDNKANVPQAVYEIINDFVNGSITIEQAREKVLNWKASLPA